ncbi:MAG TPA: ATPase, T2SS/T4P/T4SS family, partial [Nitrolancea sp.]|nr:ATPase, T2SS/T4P/T4SS family [Nitrolancea sp.]
LLVPTAADADRIRGLIRELVTAYQAGQAGRTDGLLLPDVKATCERLADDVLGMGILEPLMRDRSVEEITVNGPARVWVYQHGAWSLVQGLRFESNDDLLALMKRVVGNLGGRLDEAAPRAEVRLGDGSRLNVVIPPVAVDGCAVTIRKFLLQNHSLADLVTLGTLSREAADFLSAAVCGGVNILVSGGTGAGKTTLLNALGAALGTRNERVVTIDEVVELQLRTLLPACVALQTRGGNTEGAGELTIRDLVRTSLRMRPHRIIIGEVRGEEALDMLLALNSGHDGSLGTIHANSPADALAKLATLARMAPEQLPADVLTEMVAATVELVVQLRTDPATNRRRVVHIFEVTGLEGGRLAGQDLWLMEQGRLVWTGLRPQCLDKIQARDIPYALPHVFAALAEP